MKIVHLNTCLGRCTSFRAAVYVNPSMNNIHAPSPGIEPGRVPKKAKQKEEATFVASS